MRSKKSLTSSEPSSTVVPDMVYSEVCKVRDQCLSLVVRSCLRVQLHFQPGFRRDFVIGTMDAMEINAQKGCPRQWIPRVPHEIHKHKNPRVEKIYYQSCFETRSSSRPVCYDPQLLRVSSLGDAPPSASLSGPMSSPRLCRARSLPITPVAKPQKSTFSKGTACSLRPAPPSPVLPSNAIL